MGKEELAVYALALSKRRLFAMTLSAARRHRGRRVCLACVSRIWVPGNRGGGTRPSKEAVRHLRRPLGANATKLRVRPANATQFYWLTGKTFRRALGLG
jgi:hypothetical protein